MNDETKPRLSRADRWALRMAVECGWDYRAIARQIIATELEARREVVSAMQKAGLGTRADVVRWVEVESARFAAIPRKPDVRRRRRRAWERPRYSGCTLYRYFDADGAILYIGITIAGTNRAAQHSEAAAWWHLARSCTLVHLATVEEALEAERLAIIAEVPPYNRRHHPVWDTPEGRRERRAAWLAEDDPA